VLSVLSSTDNRSLLPYVWQTFYIFRHSSARHCNIILRADMLSQIYMWHNLLKLVYPKLLYQPRWGSYWTGSCELGLLVLGQPQTSLWRGSAWAISICRHLHLVQPQRKLTCNLVRSCFVQLDTPANTTLQVMRFNQRIKKHAFVVVGVIAIPRKCARYFCKEAKSLRTPRPFQQNLEVLVCWMPW